MIAIIHETMIPDLPERALNALLSGGYGLRIASEDEIGRAVLEPRTSIVEQDGLPSRDLLDHPQDEPSAIAHAIECLGLRRIHYVVRHEVETVLEAVVRCSLGNVPSDADFVVSISTATPWSPFRLSWWKHGDGPRDGSIPMQTGVDPEDILPTCVLIDYWIGGDETGHIGMSAVKMNIDPERLEIDPMETMRVLETARKSPTLHQREAR